MHIIKRPTLISFYEKYKDAKSPLESWWHEAKRARWASPLDIKMSYKTASFLDNNRVVFNIGGNRFRLVVKINYPSQTIFIRFIGTHKEYDKINPEVI